VATAGYPRSVQLIPQGKAKRVLCDPQDSVNILADWEAWSMSGRLSSVFSDRTPIHSVTQLKKDIHVNVVADPPDVAVAKRHLKHR